MTRRRLRVQADGYGVTVDLRVDHAGNVTVEEMSRALQLAVAQAMHEHAQADR